MDTFGFILKRADQRMLAFQRALLKPYFEEHRLTPGRYLILFVIQTVGFPTHKHGKVLSQSQIVRELGVTKVTVSKALKSMESLGLIRRESQFPGRRKKDVYITDLGRQLLRMVEEEFIRPGIVWIAVLTALGGRREKLGGVAYWLDEMRRRFLDGAEFLFPETPRELFPFCRHATPPPFAWPGATDS
jgi:DNA-binding MarR family transcriptional regulator